MSSLAHATVDIQTGSAGLSPKLWLLAAVVLQGAALAMLPGPAPETFWPDATSRASQASALSVLESFELEAAGSNAPEMIRPKGTDRRPATPVKPISVLQPIDLDEPGNSPDGRYERAERFEAAPPTPNPHEHADAWIREEGASTDASYPRLSATQTPPDVSPTIDPIEPMEPAPSSESEALAASVAISGAESVEKSTDGVEAPSPRNEEAPTPRESNGERAAVSVDVAAESPDWLLAPSGSGFAIQLAAFTSRPSALEFLAKQGLGDRDDVVVVATTSRGRQWHAVVLGPYADKSAAGIASSAVVAQYPDMNPWIRSVRSIAATRVQ